MLWTVFCPTSCGLVASPGYPLGLLFLRAAVTLDICSLVEAALKKLGSPGHYVNVCMVRAIRSCLSLLLQIQGGPCEARSLPSCPRFSQSRGDQIDPPCLHLHVPQATPWASSHLLVSTVPQTFISKRTGKFPCQVFHWKHELIVLFVLDHLFLPLYL